MTLCKVLSKFHHDTPLRMNNEMRYYYSAGKVHIFYSPSTNIITQRGSRATVIILRPTSNSVGVFDVYFSVIIPNASICQIPLGATVFLVGIRT